jgi:hypothetical protein
MKYAYLLLPILAFGCGAPDGAVDEPEIEIGEVTQAFAGPPPNRVLYRGYRCFPTHDCDHFLTTNPSDITNAGYVSDGPIGQCWSTASEGRMTLYRLWHAGTRQHLYTVDATERQNAIAAGWVSEASPCAVYRTKAFWDLKPMWRFYSSGWSDHLYTTSQGERDVLITSGSGWSPEPNTGEPVVWLY